MFTLAMVDTLIVYAHPATKGHNATILKNVQKQLKKRKESFMLLDLYKMGYDPVLHENEHSKKVISYENQQIQRAVTDVKQLIFIYPIWWGSMPAILKGFFDKIFTAQFAYKYKKLPFSIFGMKAKPIGLLNGKKAAVFITTGSLSWTQRLFMRNVYRYTAKKLILGFCGIKTKVYSVGGCGDPICKKRERKIEKNVREGLRWLF